MFAGCNKDKDDDSNIQYYRLIEANVYADSNNIGKTEYKYDGDRLSEMISYSISGGDTAWKSYYKQEFYYPDNNTFEKVLFNKDNGEWQEETKEVTTHLNGLWQHISKYTESGVLTSKADYTYDGDKIINRKFYLKAQDGMILNTEYSFTWIGKTPSTAIYNFYGDGSVGIILKDTFTLSNNKIVKIEGSLEFTKDDNKMMILIDYEGDNVVSIVDYINDSGSWVESSSDLFEYDENGNLTKWIQGSTQIITTYKYEEGKGNMDLIYGTSTDFYYFYFPMPAISEAGKDILGEELPDGKIPFR